MTVIEARGLRKAFGRTVALDGVDLRVDEGRILGIIGPNGAGKTTALNAILGLTSYQGELRVLGRDPWAERDRLMRDVCFIGDEADITHEPITLGPGIASKHSQFSLTGSEAENCVERGGLAGAVGTDDAEDAALVDTQINTVQRDGPTEGLAQAACFDHCHFSDSFLEGLGAVSDDGLLIADAPFFSSSSFFR